MSRLTLTVSSLTCSLILAGCVSNPVQPAAEADLARSREQYKTLIDGLRRANDTTSGFYVDDEPAISIAPMSKDLQEAKAKEWLTNMMITLDPARDRAIPANELIRMFRQQYGMNIVTTMPLNGYSYNGLGVTNVDAETAMSIFLGPMGLDFDIDNERKVVTIQPMKPRTWTLNLGNRRTNFSSGTPTTGSNTGMAGATGTATSTGTSGSTGTGQTSSLTGATTGATGVGQTGLGGTGSTAGSTPGSSANSVNSVTGITATDDFWNSLNREIRERLSVMIPRPDAAARGMAPVMAGAPMPAPMGDAAPAAGAAAPSPVAAATSSGSTSTEGDMYRSQAVGRFSINPETGAIWVQAPKYVLKNIDEYLTKVQDMYNTAITFEGQIVTVTSTKARSEGIDWTAFNSVANGDFTTVVQNSILGGVIMSAAGSAGVVNSMSVGNTSIPGSTSVLGVMSASKQFALFNAFLSSVGQVKILDTPLVNTTSGIPVKFEKQQTRYYTRYSQTAATGGVGGAAIATNTEDIPYNIGMTLRINPRYDANTGMVRAQFALSRSILSGWDSKVNVLTTGSGFQNIPSRIPNISSTSNDGEILLKDGDMIVVGGMTEDTEENTDSGVTGTMETPLRVLTGQSARNKTSTTYYFAIRVSVKRKQ